MGLPQLDFRVPEATWFKSAVARRIAAMPWLTSFTSRFGSLPTASSAGALAWPYKIAVVAVMMLVASGTLVTFGMAGAETADSNGTSALPGSDEASPTIEGQVLPGNALSPGLFNPGDLLSTLDLTDFSPIDSDGLAGEDDDNDDDDENTSDAIRDRLNGASTPTSNPTNGSTPKPSPTTDAPEVEGPKHKQWVADQAAYEDAYEDYEDAKSDLDEWEDKNDKYQDCRQNPLNYIGKNCDKDFNPGPKPSVPQEPQSPGSEPDYTD